MTKRFAEGTEVSVERSRAEFEQLLRKHGATEFALHWEATRSTVLYRLRGRMVRQVVEFPKAEAFRKDARGNVGTPAVVQRRCEAEWRRRWRALLLITKAKLETIAGGGSTVEREFLADTLLPNGQTVAEALLPRIAESYESGKMPTLLLGAGNT